MHWKMLEMIAQSKALEFKRKGTITFTFEQIEDLKPEYKHEHIMKSEFNSTLVQLYVSPAQYTKAIRLFDHELRKIFTD